MDEPRLRVRSARVCTLAREIAEREGRTIKDVVERALDQYERATQGPPTESAKEFWNRMSRDYGADIDLNTVIGEGTHGERRLTRK